MYENSQCMKYIVVDAHYALRSININSTVFSFTCPVLTHPTLELVGTHNTGTYIYTRRENQNRSCCI